MNILNAKYGIPSMKCRWSVNVTATQVVLQNKMRQMQIIHLLLDILGLLLI